MKRSSKQADASPRKDTYTNARIRRCSNLGGGSLAYIPPLDNRGPSLNQNLGKTALVGVPHCSRCFNVHRTSSFQLLNQGGLMKRLIVACMAAASLALS